MNLALPRAAALCVVVPALVAACGGGTAHPYVPPKGGPTASLMLTTDTTAAEAEVYAGFYDNPATDCSSDAGYMGFVRYRAKLAKAHAIPAGRRIQVSPGYSADRRFCVGFTNYSFQPEPGRAYRVRHWIEKRTVPCTSGADGAMPKNCGTLLTEVEEQICHHVVEVRDGTAWSAAPDVKTLDFRSRCAAPAGGAK